MMRASRGLRARLRGLRLDDRGISTLEVLIMFPILVFSMMMAIQLSMNYYAKEVAFAAAERGAEVGARTGSTAAAKAASIEFLHEHAGWLVTNDTNIGAVAFQATQMQVTVSGTPVTLISILTGPKFVKVKQVAIVPLEQFTFDPAG